PFPLPTFPALAKGFELEWCRHRQVQRSLHHSLTLWLHILDLLSRIVQDVLRRLLALERLLNGRDENLIGDLLPVRDQRAARRFRSVQGFNQRGEVLKSRLFRILL